MKKYLTSMLALAGIVALSACAADGSAQEDETLTQAPYAEERTVGPAERAPVVRSAEPVFVEKQMK